EPHRRVHYTDALPILARQHAVAVERRRAEDRIREERHDAFAKIVRAGNLDEQRYRSEDALSVGRQELAREGSSRRSTRTRKPPRSEEHTSELQSREKH